MPEKFDGGNSRRVWDIVTGDESWIYQFDPGTKRQSQVWVFPGDDPPTKVKRPRSVGERMVASFFGVSGDISTIPLMEKKTVTAEWYTTF
jgi:histone-lysine N-methyltransferase SETMAR